MSAHGYVAYTHGCRCTECRAAKAEYIRNKRAEARAYAKGPLVGPDGRHYVPEASHGIAGYKDHACRCDVCTEAKHREHVKRYAKATA